MTYLPAMTTILNIDHDLPWYNYMQQGRQAMRATNVCTGQTMQYTTTQLLNNNHATFFLRLSGILINSVPEMTLLLVVRITEKLIFIW